SANVRGIAVALANRHCHLHGPVAAVASDAATLARKRARKGKLMAEQQTKPDILVYGLPKPVVISGLSDAFILHKFENHRDLSRLSAAAAGKIRGVAVTELLPVDATMLSRLPKVEIIAAFGVG